MREARGSEHTALGAIHTTARLPDQRPSDGAATGPLRNSCAPPDAFVIARRTIAVWFASWFHLLCSPPPTNLICNNVVGNCTVGVAGLRVHLHALAHDPGKRQL